MYRLVVFFITIVFAVAGCGQKSGAGNSAAVGSVPDTGKPVISFDHYEHDFGRMIEGESLAHVFTFKNTGTADLLITSASSSCGCTIPKYDKKPIHPNQSGKMEVVFNSTGKMGKQKKTIAVRANTDPPVTLLTVYAEVMEKDK